MWDCNSRWRSFSRSRRRNSRDSWALSQFHTIFTPHRRCPSLLLSGRRAHLQRNRFGQLFPFRFFGSELFLADLRKSIVFELALSFFRHFPLRYDPAFTLHTMQSWVERPVLDLQKLLRSALYVLGNLMSVRRAKEQCAQDQHIESALQKFSSV